jgi:hypothetical protein
MSYIDENEIEWFNALKEGDQVFYEGPQSNRLLEVTRFTKTIMELSNGTRVRRSNGKVLGGTDLSWATISKPTQEKVLSIAIAVRRRKVRHFDFELLTGEQITRICGIINENVTYD